MYIIKIHLGGGDWLPVTTGGPEGVVPLVFPSAGEALSHIKNVWSVAWQNGNAVVEEVN